jgi:excisionase family DNA binding protein
MALALLKPFCSMENNIDPFTLLTLKEAAEVLRVSTRTVHRMVGGKELPAFKVGGQWRLRESELQKWLEGLNELGL